MMPSHGGRGWTARNDNATRCWRFWSPSAQVAPPGKSLHRCGTELDLGPPSAYGWLARNAERFHFVQRYAWEPWHW
jgi:hypothetical protein